MQCSAKPGGFPCEKCVADPTCSKEEKTRLFDGLQYLTPTPPLSLLRGPDHERECMSTEIAIMSQGLSDRGLAR